MSDAKFDIVVVGAGPGGYVAAIRAAQLGLKAAVVEREHLGGVCLNWGCIPTKALLRCADVYRSMRHAKDYGLGVEGLTFDFDALIKRSRAVAGQLSAGVKTLLKKNRVAVFNGFAKLAGKGKVCVEADGKPPATLEARHIILATGARARQIPGMEADGDIIWTYRDALAPTVMPKSLLVVGSGAIGIEFASFFHTFGAKVTVVEIMDRIVPAEDAEISAALEKSLVKQGVTIMTKARVTSVKTSATNAVAAVERAGETREITADRVIMAVGVVANVEGIGLEGTKIQQERGHIVANQWCETHEPGVYAIGDLTKGPWLAHKASHEGIVCVEKIAGVKDAHPLDVSTIPNCTYCHPQVASVGLSEAGAKAAGHDIRVGRFPFIGNGKAIALGEPEGLVKTIFDAKTGELLGAHMIGAEVTELIHGFGVAKTLETTEVDLMRAVFPHPTLSEMMHESALDAYGRAIHF